MSVPLASFCGSWRHRLVNNFTVFSIDHSKESRERAHRGCTTTLALVQALTRDFLQRVPTRTLLHAWAENNAFLDSNLQFHVVTSDSFSRGVLAHEPEQKSVRSLRVSDTIQLPAKMGELPRDACLTVVFLCVAFQSRGDNAIAFNEFILLGVMPSNGARYSPRPTLADNITLNMALDRLSAASKTFLRQLYLPRVRVAAFTKQSADGSITDEQIASFCIRWHIARRGRSTGNLFQQVVGGTQKDEVVAHLTSKTARYFTQAPASSVLFDNDTLPCSVVRFWQANTTSRPVRVWMARQLADALTYLVDEFVVKCSRLARTLFFDTSVRPFLAFYAPHLVLERRGDTSVSVDWASQALSRVHVDLHKLAETHPPLQADGEKPLAYIDGKLVLPLSTACRMFAATFREVIMVLIDAASAGDSTMPTHPRTVVGESAFPIDGGDLYAEVRDMRLDDYPLDGVVYRTTAAMNGGDVSSLSFHNLPASNGMVKLVDANNGGGAAGESGPAIPLRQSTQMIKVSGEALHSMCSNVDIEDLGDVVVVEENPVALLHRRHALPLCVRQYTHGMVDGNTHANHAARNYLYRFLVSLKLADVDAEKIREFLMLNTEPARRREYVALIGGLEKFYLRSRTESNGGRQIMTTCSKNAEEKKDGVYPCPYSGVERNLPGAEAQLSALIARVNPLLAGDADALQRIVTAARTSRARAGCMQEFVETRRKLNAETPALADQAQTIARPCHYVYASAEHSKRSEPASSTTTT